MFRKTLFVAGLLWAVTLASCGGASASSRHLQSWHGTSHHVGRGTMRLARYHRGSRPSPAASTAVQPDIASSLASLFAFTPAVTTPAPAVAAPSMPMVVTRAPASTGGVQTGRASFYGGGRTASGGNVGAATCAHRSLPFGTRVLVTNLANAHQAILTVNDRGPFVRGRIVDVSVGAASVLGMLHSGTAPVSVQVVSGRG